MPISNRVPTGTQTGTCHSERCPRCNSPSPELHPAMQYEGEVQECSHQWHSMPSSLAAKIASTPPKHDNNNPLWKGPCGAGPLGGITQSMLVRFMSCRERFRLKYVLGLEPPDRWVKTIGYGNMWHVCEEALASGQGIATPNGVGLTEYWQVALKAHTIDQLSRYRMQEQEITKWFNVCSVQFPEYVKYWAEHPDVQNRTPLMQEQVFDVPYQLPSGRVVRLRGKFDSVDLIDGGVWLQENKSKGDVDKQQIERQLKFDLQTLLYIVALERTDIAAILEPQGIDRPRMGGVRYNVVRRPLSGGVGNIKPHAAKYTKTTAAPAESTDAFYERLRRDYIANDPAYWFFRVRAEVSQRDIQVFRDTCLDPLLEQLCWWYDEVTWSKGCKLISTLSNRFPPMSYRTPFGVWSALEEGGSTEYDAYLDNGSEVGLRRVETLFGELQC